MWQPSNFRDQHRRAVENETRAWKALEAARKEYDRLNAAYNVAKKERTDLEAKASPGTPRAGAPGEWFTGKRTQV